MQLRIQPTEDSLRFQMHIVYGVDTVAGLRPYELVIVDPGKGLYAIDEKNSIVMESYLLGGKLYNRFEVQGNLLLSTTELIGDKLEFEVISGNMAPVSITGGKAETDEIPPVKAYPVVTRQWALLQRR